MLAQDPRPLEEKQVGAQLGAGRLAAPGFAAPLLRR